MTTLFENEDYGEFIHSLRDIVTKIPCKEEGENGLNQAINAVEESLNDFSKLKHAIDQSIIVAVTNTKGEILYANDKFCEISQYSRNELIGKNHRMINSGYHDKLFFQNMWDTILNGEMWEGNIRNKAKDGTYYWVKSMIVPFCNEENKPYMFIALRTDITKGKESEEKLVKALKNDFNMIVSAMHCLIFYVTKEESGQFFYLMSEGKLANQLGFTTSYIYKKSPREIFLNELGGTLERQYEKAYTGQTVTYDYSLNKYHLLTTLSPVYEDGEINKLIGCISDISELNRAKEKVEFLAYHDALTNIPNRRKFTEDITRLLKKRTKFALFLMDLDRFKYINDTLGHTLGDELLKILTIRLRTAIGANGYFYRFAGDEFIFLVPWDFNHDSLRETAEKLLAIFQEKIHLAYKKELYVTGSIGISMYPEHGGDMDTLIKNADSAMYAAKRLGKNLYKLYDDTMKQENEKSLQMETYLRTAIKNEEFTLFFQPKYNLKENNIHSMEALLRWHHPVLGDVSPSVFIPLAEETGIIWEIDEWVLRTACLQNKEWSQSEWFDGLRVAVNISAIHFSHPNFVEMVKRVLMETGLDPARLELEITETAIIQNTEECLHNMELLKKMGVLVSIDDFGTGYTSLNYLKKFSFSYLKIDQSYIKEMSKNKEDMAIVKMIITLAHELQLKVIAEGVEEDTIFDRLKQFGCDEIQGYYVSRPLPKKDFETMLKKMDISVDLK